MSDTILVIGATGNVGRPLVALLARKGACVRAASRRPESFTEAEGVEAVSFEYGRTATWSVALDGVDRLFLLAQGAGDAPDQTMIPFLGRARAAGVGSVVLMTAMGVDQTERGLRKVERYLIASDLPYTILRPNWFMQNFHPGSMGEMIQKEGKLSLPTGNGKASLIDTRDIAAVAAVALTEANHAGKEYTLTGSESFSFAEAVAVLSSAAGRTIPYVAVSEEAAGHSLTAEGWPPTEIDLMLYLYRAVRAGLYAPISTDLSDVLGRPPLTLQQFAEENANVWA